MGKFDTYPDDWKKIPIKDITLREQSPFIEKANALLQLYEEFYLLNKKANNRIAVEFKINTKFHVLIQSDSNSLVHQLEKISNRKLKLENKDEWAEYFDSIRSQMISLQVRIKDEKNKLNKMVYDLYKISAHDLITIEEKTSKPVALND